MEKFIGCHIQRFHILPFLYLKCFITECEKSTKLIRSIFQCINYTGIASLFVRDFNTRATNPGHFGEYKLTFYET